MALQLGAGFVARSFSGDKSQLIPLIKAGISYRGFALIDCISPCVTFNNHKGSKKSFDYVREHNLAVMKADVIPERAEITTAYEEGTSVNVTLHDGAHVRLHKLNADYDPHDRVAALARVQEIQAEGEIPTGLIFLDREETDSASDPEYDGRSAQFLGFGHALPGGAKIVRNQCESALIVHFL